MVEHHVVGFRQQGWVARDVGVLVEDDLEEVWGEDGRGFEAFLRPKHVLLLSIGPWRGAGQI